VKNQLVAPRVSVDHRHPRYKDFPKHDLRRYFALLLAIERLAERATMHYLAIQLDCTRAEVARAVAAIKQNLMVSIEKTGPVYRITSWGVLSEQAVKQCMNEDLAPVSPKKQKLVGKDVPMWTRELESRLVERCVEAAKSSAAAASADEADVFRLVAQLVKTRHPDMAAALERSTAAYYSKHKTCPRPFPDVVRAGLVKDVSRFRNVMEHHLMGVRSW
jgi:hypothetical protein